MVIYTIHDALKHRCRLSWVRPIADARVQLLADLADETRLAVLERLERGPASASELAERLDVSPTQLANHLRRLRDAGLVTVAHRGRLAIYELGEPGLREIFSMLNGLRGRPPSAGRPVPLAATCYDHLAGQLGVALMDHLVDAGALQPRTDEGELVLGPEAKSTFADLGVEIPAKDPRRMLAYSCMDSLAGRPHLGGQLGANLATSLRNRGWLARSQHHRRPTLTEVGRNALHRHGITLDTVADEAI
jgi:DNA-binding transcriptional ArsR family regulator